MTNPDQSCTSVAEIPEWAMHGPVLELDRRWESDAEWEAYSARIDAHSERRRKWWDEPTVETALVSVRHAIDTRQVEERMFQALKISEARAIYVKACEDLVPELVLTCGSQPLPRKAEEKYPDHTLSPRTVSAIEAIWWPHTPKAASRVEALYRLSHPYSDVTLCLTHHDRVQRSMDRLGRYYWRGKLGQEEELRLLRCLLLMESCRSRQRTGWSIRPPAR